MRGYRAATVSQSCMAPRTGFAAFDKSAPGEPRARYRPMGIAEAPDGSLYVVDSQPGRLWRINYDATPAHD